MIIMTTNLYAKCEVGCDQPFLQAFPLAEDPVKPKTWHSCEGKIHHLKQIYAKKL